MATYNGADYLAEQLDSIFRQLRPDDEIVVVDDASADSTVAIVESYNDARIRLHRNVSNLGHVASFSIALTHATCPVVVFADQDDIWPPGRLDLVRRELREHDLFLGAMSFFGASSPPPMRPGDARGHNACNVVQLIAGRVPYFGCAMAFQRHLLRYALPFPTFVEAHDQWIALVGNICGRVVHRDHVVVHRRLHDGNLTPRSRRRILLVLRSRVLHLGMILVCIARLWTRRACVER